MSEPLILPPSEAECEAAMQRMAAEDRGDHEAARAAWEVEQAEIAVWRTRYKDEIDSTRVPPSPEVTAYARLVSSRPREHRPSRRQRRSGSNRAGPSESDDPEPPGGRHPDDLDGGSAS